MLRSKISKITILMTAVMLISGLSCMSRHAIRYSLYPIQPGSSIAVIVDSPNNIKNVVLSKYMKNGYKVKAFNASDFYTMNDVYDIKDFKRVAYYGGADTTLLSLEKSFNNIFKLHVYNYELNKAESLDEIRNKYNVTYLILLDLKNWEQLSWGRAIDLRTQDLVWVENYPTKYNDSVESVVSHFIDSMSKK